MLHSMCARLQPNRIEHRSAPSSLCLEPNVQQDCPERFDRPRMSPNEYQRVQTCKLRCRDCLQALGFQLFIDGAESSGKGAN